jgi:hypothetical protein
VVEDWRVVLDGRRPGRRAREPGEVVLERAAASRFGQARLGPIANLLVLDGREEILGLEARVPDLQRPHLAELGEVGAIGTYARERTVPAICLAEVQPTSDDEACGEALDVPLPRGRERLVEVVDVEDDAALGRREAAKVHQMSVAASLHAETRHRRAREIHRHVERRASVEGER